MNAWGKKLTAEEAWDWSYQLRPYLERCTESELFGLRDEALRLSMELTQEGKIGPNVSDPDGTFTAQKLWHVRKEFLRRNMQLETAFSGGALPFTDDHLFFLKNRRDLAHKWRLGNCFSRIGKERWIRELYERGEMLLRPASFYKSQHNDIARQDDEMLLRTLITPYDFDLGLVDYLTCERGWHIRKIKKPREHYIYCLANSLKPRYVSDFKGEDERAEAAVIIHSIHDFLSRMVRELSRKLFDWDIQLAPVRYIDPYTCIHDPVACGQNPYFIKNSRYLYQGEFRIALIPPVHMDYLPDLPISIGAIDDIAELIVF